MKKILALLLALVILCVPITAFAINDGESGTVEIQDHEYSTYTITIPECIMVDYDHKFIVEISDINIERGYHVEVTPTNLDENGRLTLYHTDDNNYSKQIELPNILATFYSNYDDMIATAACEYTLVDDFKGGKAGIYSGTLTYTCNCVYDNYGG